MRGLHARTQVATNKDWLTTGWAILSNLLFAASSVVNAFWWAWTCHTKTFTVVPIPVCPFPWLYPRPPYFWSSSHFPAWLITKSSKAIHCCQWVHEVIYSNLRPLRFHTNWIVICTNQSSNNHDVFLSPLLFKVNPELRCHATTVHSLLAPIYQAVLCINQAQTFSSSFGWSHSALGMSWARGTRVTVMSNVGVWATSSCTCLCPLALLMLRSGCTTSSYVGLLLILTNSVTWWIQEYPTHDG